METPNDLIAYMQMAMINSSHMASPYMGVLMATAEILYGFVMCKLAVVFSKWRQMYAAGWGHVRVSRAPCTQHRTMKTIHM